MHRIIETCICMQLIGDFVFDAEWKNIYVKEEEQKRFTFTIVVHLWIVYFMKQL